MVSHYLLLSKDYNHNQFPAALRILLPLLQSALLKMLATEDYRCLISQHMDSGAPPYSSELESLGLWNLPF